MANCCWVCWRATKTASPREPLTREARQASSHSAIIWRRVATGMVSSSAMSSARRMKA